MKEPAENIGRIHAKCADDRLLNWQTNNNNKDTIINPGHFCKIKFTDTDIYGNIYEHMWVKVVTTKDNNEFTGILDNDPVSVTNVLSGDTIKFEFKDISELLIFI